MGGFSGLNHFQITDSIVLFWLCNCFLQCLQIKNDYFDLNLVHIVYFCIFSPHQTDRKLQLWNNSSELVSWISYIFQDSLLSCPCKAVIIRLNLYEVGNGRAEQMEVHEIDLCPTVSWSAIPDWMHHKVCVDVELYWLSSIVIKRQL